MEFIAHRINTIKELHNLPSKCGVEIDLRDDLHGNIYLSHDPFVPGQDFEKYLFEYHHGTMILNIKSERIEHKVIELLKKYKIKQYFFLDSSFPMIKQLSDEGERNIAIRFSEYEGLDTLVAMKEKVDWVWVDTFSKIPLTKEIYNIIRDMGYRMCFVSPELQNQEEKIKQYIDEIKECDYKFDAVCSKYRKWDEWNKTL